MLTDWKGLELNLNIQFSPSVPILLETLALMVKHAARRCISSVFRSVVENVILSAVI